MEQIMELLANPMQLLSMTGALLFMVVSFGLCIFVHELGHFLVARACGLHVIAFSIGFKKIWGKKIGGVEYRIGCLPFGGYVDLPQIDSSGVAKDENGNELPKAGPWARIATAFAGPLCNVIFGLLLACFIWHYGLPQATPKMKEFKVLSVEEESPEYEAGLRKGDVIVKLNGKEFNTTWTDFARDIMLEVGDTRLDILRDGNHMQVVYKTKINKNAAPGEDIPYPFFRPEVPVIIHPEKDSIAAKAGLLADDKVIKVNGKEIFGIDELDYTVLYSTGKQLELTVLRNGEEKIFTVVPEPYIDPVTKSALTRHMLGITNEFMVDEKKIKVIDVNPLMPGNGILFKGDIITAVDGKTIDDANFLSKHVEELKETALTLTVERAGETLELSLTPAKITFGTIGVAYYNIRSYPNPFEQFMTVIEGTYKSLRAVTVGIKNKLGFDDRHTTLKVSHFSGPVGIGRYLYISVYRGSLLVGINLVVMITFSLGLLNLLPIPVLDGGHIMLAIYELIFKKPLPVKYLQPVTVTFVTFLIGFMLFVTFFDFKKLFGL